MNAAVRALLDGIVDYAGLFPPAQLPMQEAVANYATYISGPHAWMLGRFVVPSARLAEFAGMAESFARGGSVWRVSVLLNDVNEAPTLAAFNAAHRGIVCDSAEIKGGTVDDITAIGRALRGVAFETFVEIPSAGDVAPLVGAIGANGVRAKIRTGGVVADAFPGPSAVVGFLSACVRTRTPFKATAGLHHAVCGDYRLTYAPDSPSGRMFGFVNLFLAAALLRDGACLDDAEALLTDRDAASFAGDDTGIRWRGHLLLTARLTQLRRQLALSFGSCSFREPVDELTALGLI